MGFWEWLTNGTANEEQPPEEVREETAEPNVEEKTKAVAVPERKKRNTKIDGGKLREAVRDFGITESALGFAIGRHGTVVSHAVNNGWINNEDLEAICEKIGKNPLDFIIPLEEAKTGLLIPYDVWRRMTVEYTEKLEEVARKIDLLYEAIQGKGNRQEDPSAFAQTTLDLPLNDQSNGDGNNPKMKVPTFDEVEKYVESLKNPLLDAKQIYDRYDGNGWTDQYGNPLSDWRRAVLGIHTAKIRGETKRRPKNANVVAEYMEKMGMPSREAQGQAKAFIEYYTNADWKSQNGWEPSTGWRYFAGRWTIKFMEKSTKGATA